LLAVHHNWAKGAALFAAMLEVMPRKKFYLKIDLDTLILPKALLPLLRSLNDLPAHPIHAPHLQPLYFGNGCAHKRVCGE